MGLELNSWEQLISLSTQFWAVWPFQFSDSTIWQFLIKVWTHVCLAFESNSRIWKSPSSLNIAVWDYVAPNTLFKKDNMCDQHTYKGFGVLKCWVKFVNQELKPLLSFLQPPSWGESEGQIVKYRWHTLKKVFKRWWYSRFSKTHTAMFKSVRLFNILKLLPSSKLDTKKYQTSFRKCHSSMHWATEITRKS